MFQLDLGPTDYWAREQKERRNRERKSWSDGSAGWAYVLEGKGVKKKKKRKKGERKRKKKARLWAG